MTSSTADTTRVEIRFEDRVVPLAEGESVLDGLLRSGAEVAHSCRSGLCQSCMMVAREGEIPAIAQQGLKDSLRQTGHFLSCVAKPTAPMVVARPDAALEWESLVVETRDVGAAVRLIRLSVPDGFVWRAGQFITLLRGLGLARSYSIASRPADGWLELHVRRVAGGAMSNWLHDGLAVGEPIRFRGPQGECFHSASDATQPLLLAGTGTGLAPLYGVIRDALAQGHRGPITLWHGALRENGLYHRDELLSITRNHPNFTYRACVLEGAGPELVIGPLDAVVLAEATELKRARAYLCGDPMLVGKLRKQLFIKGMSNRMIFSDPFVQSTKAPD